MAQWYVPVVFSIPTFLPALAFPFMHADGHSTYRGHSGYRGDSPALLSGANVFTFWLLKNDSHKMCAAKRQFPQCTHTHVPKKCRFPRQVLFP